MTSEPTHQETNPEENLYWNDMRNHGYSASFPAIANFIRQHPPKRRNVNKRKSVRWALLLLLPLMFFFSCQRTTYVEPQGATLSFTAKDSLLNSIDHILQQYADKEWKAIFWPHGGTMRGVISTPAEQYDKLKEVAEKLSAMPGVTELYISAVKTTVKESPLSHLSYRLFNWHFNRVDVSDEQLYTAIESKLKETGRQDLQLKLVKENGRKQVNLIANGRAHNFSIAFTLPDGSHITATAEKW